MKKIYFLILFSFINPIFAQTTFFGNIPDLVFKKETITAPIASDTLDGNLMNFHFVRDSLKSSYLYNTHSKPQGLSVFYVGNKLGGEEQHLFGKIGSTIVTNKGVFDFGDSLLIDSPVAQPKIITFAKKDKNKSPYIFLSPIKDKTLLIPETLIFNRNLSAQEKQRIETYLSIKYGISINYISETNYLSSEGDVVWSFKDNKKYGYHITGIGRDDAFELYQKQSANTEDDVVTFALDNIKPLNSNNTGILNNMEFLLWGDNNEEIKFPNEDLLTVHSKGDMLRVWKIQAKSDTGLNTSIYFKLKNQDSPAIPKLKIFRTTENLQNDVADFFSGEKQNDSIYVFKNINWDSDHDGYDYFTLNNSESASDISIVSTCTELENGLVKVSVPDNLLSSSYSLLDLKNGNLISDHLTINSNTITFNTLLPSLYQLNIHKADQSDIIKTFDMEGISNQNIEDNYLWTGVPIELDINYENYQYTLTKPNGSSITHAPFTLDGLGDYMLTVKNKIGCEIEKTLHVLNQTDYANANNNSIFKSIKLYPNPSHDGIVTVKIELKAPKLVTIQIYNSLGKLLKQAQYNNTTNVLSTLSIPPIVGYYNMKIFIPEESKGYNLLIN